MSKINLVSDYLYLWIEQASQTLDELQLEENLQDLKKQGLKQQDLDNLRKRHLSDIDELQRLVNELNNYSDRHTLFYSIENRLKLYQDLKAFFIKKAQTIIGTELTKIETIINGLQVKIDAINQRMTTDDQLVEENEKRFLNGLK